MSGLATMMYEGNVSAPYSASAIKNPFGNRNKKKKKKCKKKKA